METSGCNESGSSKAKIPGSSDRRSGLTAKYFSITVVMIALWWGIYLNLGKISQQLTHGLSILKENKQFQSLF